MNRLRTATRSAKRYGWVQAAAHRPAPCWPRRIVARDAPTIVSPHPPNHAAGPRGCNGHCPPPPTPSLLPAKSPLSRPRRVANGLLSSPHFHIENMCRASIQRVGLPVAMARKGGTELVAATHEDGKRCSWRVEMEPGESKCNMKKGGGGGWGGWGRATELVWAYNSRKKLAPPCRRRCPPPLPPIVHNKRKNPKKKKAKRNLFEIKTSPHQHKCLRTLVYGRSRATTPA